MTRRLEGVDVGRLTVGFARWNQYYYAGSPPDARSGCRTEYVACRSELGDLPAWLVPAEPSAGAGDRGRSSCTAVAPAARSACALCR